MKKAGVLFGLALVLMQTVAVLGGTISGVTFFSYVVSEDGFSEFDIDRSYFTFKQKIDDRFSYKIQLDVGRLKNNPDNQQLSVYLKNANLNWRTPFLDLTFGLQGMNLFNTQEKTWGYRFIEKSAMDRNKFSSSADLGIGLSRRFGTNLYSSLLVTNGGGYKKAETDKYKKFSGQLCYGPTNLGKEEGFNIGGVFSREPVESGETLVYGAFGGYSGHGLRTGIEFSQLDDGVEEVASLLSLYGSYQILAHYELFARFDNSDDEDYLIGGFNYQPVSGLTIAPNVRHTASENEDAFLEYHLDFQFRF
jgi:hypothetical protein